MGYICPKLSELRENSDFNRTARLVQSYKVAHAIWDAQKGNPIWLNAKGLPSVSFEAANKVFQDPYMAAMSKAYMFSSFAKELYGEWWNMESPETHPHLIIENGEVVGVRESNYYVMQRYINENEETRLLYNNSNPNQPYRRREVSSYEAAERTTVKIREMFRRVGMLLFYSVYTNRFESQEGDVRGLKKYTTYWRRRTNINHLAETDSVEEKNTTIVSNILNSENKEVQEAVMRVLNRVMPGVKVFSNFYDFVSYVRKMGGNIEDLDIDDYGTAFAGAVYINPNKYRQDSVFHEYAHIYFDLLPDDNPTKMRLIELFGSEEDAIRSIGLIGTDRLLLEMDGSRLAKFKQLLKDFWREVKNLFANGEALKELEKESLSRLIVNEILAGKGNVSTDMLRGTQVHHMASNMPANNNTKTGAKLSVTGLINYLSGNYIASRQQRIAASNAFNKYINARSVATMSSMEDILFEALVKKNDMGDKLFDDVNGEKIYKIEDPDGNFNTINAYGLTIGQKLKDVLLEIHHDTSTDEIIVYYKDEKKYLMIPVYTGTLVDGRINKIEGIDTTKDNFISSYQQKVANMGYIGTAIHKIFEYAAIYIVNKKSQHLAPLLNEIETELLPSYAQISINIAVKKLRAIKEDLEKKHGVKFDIMPESPLRNTRFGIDARLDVRFRSAEKVNGKYLNYIFDYKTSFDGIMDENKKIRPEYNKKQGMMARPANSIPNSKKTQHGLQLKIYAAALTDEYPDEEVVGMGVISVKVRPSMQEITSLQDDQFDVFEIQGIIDVDVNSKSAITILEHYKMLNDMAESDAEKEDLKLALSLARSNRERDNLREVSRAVLFLKTIFGIPLLSGVKKSDIESLLGRGISSIIEEMESMHDYPADYFFGELADDSKFPVWALYYAKELGFSYGSIVNVYNKDGDLIQVKNDSLETLYRAIISHPKFRTAMYIDAPSDMTIPELSMDEFDAIVMNKDFQKEFNTTERDVAFRLYQANLAKVFMLWDSIGSVVDYDNMTESEKNAIFKKASSIDSISGGAFRTFLSEELLMHSFAKKIVAENTSDNRWKPYTLALYRLSTMSQNEIVKGLGVLNSSKNFQKYLIAFSQNRTVDTSNIMVQILKEESRTVKRRITATSRLFKQQLDSLYSSMTQEQKEELIEKTKIPSELGYRYYFIPPLKAKGKGFTANQIKYLELIYEYRMLYDSSRAERADAYMDYMSINGKHGIDAFNSANPILVPDRYNTKKEFKEWLEANNLNFGYALSSKMYKAMERESYDNYTFDLKDSEVSTRLSPYNGYRLGDIKNQLMFASGMTEDQIKENISLINEIREIIIQRSSISESNPRRFSVQGSFDKNLVFVTKKFHDSVIMNMNSHISNHYTSQIYPLAEYVESLARRGDDQLTKEHITEYINSKIFKQSSDAMSRLAGWLTMLVSFNVLAMNGASQIGNLTIGQLGNLIYKNKIARKGFARAVADGKKILSMMRDNNVGTMIDDIYFDELQMYFSKANKWAFFLMENVEVANQIILFAGSLTQEELDNYDVKAPIQDRFKALSKDRVNQIEATIREVHGDYGWNRALYSNNPWLKLFLMFKGGWWITLAQRTFGQSYVDAYNEEHRSLFLSTYRGMLKSAYKLRSMFMDNIDESILISTIEKKYGRTYQSEDAAKRAALKANSRMDAHPVLTYVGKDGKEYWITNAINNKISQWEEILVLAETAENMGNTFSEKVDHENYAVMARMIGAAVAMHVISTMSYNFMQAIISAYPDGDGDDDDLKYDWWNDELDNDGEGLEIGDILSTMFIKDPRQGIDKRPAYLLSSKELRRIAWLNATSKFFSRIAVDVVAAFAVPFNDLGGKQEYGQNNSMPALKIIKNAMRLAFDWSIYGSMYSETNRYPYHAYGDSKAVDLIYGIVPLGVAIKQGRYLYNTVFTDNYKESLVYEFAFREYEKVLLDQAYGMVMTRGGMNMSADQLNEAIKDAVNEVRADDQQFEKIFESAYKKLIIMKNMPYATEQKKADKTRDAAKKYIKENPSVKAIISEEALLKKIKDAQ